MKTWEETIKAFGTGVKMGRKIDADLLLETMDAAKRLDTALREQGNAVRNLMKDLNEYQSHITSSHHIPTMPLSGALRVAERHGNIETAKAVFESLVLAAYGEGSLKKVRALQLV